MLNILVVDDEVMVRRGLIRLLETAPADIAAIETADDGAEALAMIESCKPNVVITDIRMPHMDGIELCRRVAELQAGIQLVVVSGYGEFEYAQRCLAYDVKAYLLKPITSQALHEVLDKLQANLRKSAVSVPSLPELHQWVKSAEAAVWDADAEELERVLGRFDDRLALDLAGSGGQGAAMLLQILQLIVQALNERGVLQFDKPEKALTPTGALQFPEALRRFHDQIRSLIPAILHKRREGYKDPVEEAKMFIESRLAEEVTLEETAQYIGLTPNYFSYLFKRETGETFLLYRIKRRMERAKQMLELPHVRVVDVAAEVGYMDHTYFARTFKKHTGLLPSEYRKRLGIH